MLKRIGLSGAGAAAITVALGLGMMAMIAVDFKAEEKYAAAAFEINPVADDIALPQPRQKLEAMKKVEVPPPLPIIERVAADKPSEPIADEPLTPDFPDPVINTGGYIIQVSNKDEQPVVRIPPVMPPRAERSGHCMMQFDVSAWGEPYNIKAASCTQRLFERASIKAVSRWKYHPKIQNGQAVSRAELTTRISFNLSDARGQRIPE